MTKIENVIIVNYNETISNADVLIDNGKIIDIIKKEGQGDKYLIPGLIDIHTHGMLGKDIMDGEQAQADITAAMAKNGTTSFMPTLMTAPWNEILETLKNISNKNPEGANIIGYHLEGPFISIEKKGAHNPDLIIPATKEKLEELVNASSSKLRRLVISSENFDISLIPYLIENDITPVVGHSNATAKQTEKYVKAGVKAVTHLWNGMSTVENRNPGIAEEALINNEITAELITDLVHVDEKTIKLSIDKKGSDKITIITDSIRPAGLPDGESTSGGFIIVKKGEKITLKETGTIAGSASTMFGNFQKVIKIGYSLNDAVRMCSTNQSLIYKLNKGMIAKGYDADLLVLDKNLNLEAVYIDGKLVKYP